MNRLKKYASLLLALVMALALAVPAMAGENVEGGEPVAPEENAEATVATSTISLPKDMADHTFVAYQIFSGTQKNTAEDDAPLADIKWGNGIDEDAFLVALKESKDFGETNPFANATSAENVAKVLEDYVDNSTTAIAFARIATKCVVANKGITLREGEMNEVPQGYYLIVDTTELGDGTDTVRNASLLQLTKDVTITVKVDVPQVDKQVQENSDEKFGEAADYTIGDDVPFKFVSAVPDMAQYETYKYIFHDKMDNGLTFNADSVVVKIGDTTVPATVDGKVNYTVVTTEELTDECTFEIRFEDLKTIAAATKGAAVEITFTAKLNSSAVIGSGGNKNKVQLEYSNDPSDVGDGETGKTPEDEVIVFTYELETNKVNNAETPEKLQGAEFHLARTRAVGDTTVEEWAIVENGKVVRWVEAKEGEQTYVPADDPNNLNGTAYAGSVLTSGADGLFVVAGLDAGTYKLLETKAPAGYNTPKEAFTVVISRDLDQTETGAGYSNLAVTLDDVATEGVDNNSGKLPVTIVNQSGATLPETGGIGTTIFYALGGLLTVGAVVLLVTKKRMSADEK